jgi:hypothetical protein
MLVALDFAFGPSLEVVIAGDSGAADTQNMLKDFVQPLFLTKWWCSIHPVMGKPLKNCLHTVKNS